jgi:hypothetical protein
MDVQQEKTNGAPMVARGRAAVAAALAKAQGEFPTIERTRTVRVDTRDGRSYTFDYAPLDVTLSAVRPALAKHGLALYHEVGLEPGEDPRVIVEAVLVHESGEELRSGKLVAPFEAKIQALGSATTYLKRYTAEALLGVCAEQDDDGNAAQGNGRIMQDRPPRAEPPKPAAKPEVKTSDARDARLLELNGALVKLGLGGEHAASLRGEEKRKFLLGRWLMWLSWAVGREVAAPKDLTDQEIATALSKAVAGEMPA